MNKILELELDKTPTGQEEFEDQFSDPDDERKRLQNDRLRQDNQQSQKYCKRAYKITKIWLWFLIIVIIAQFSCRAFGHGLGESEYIATVVSLTGSVFGFWYLVGKYLFNPGGLVMEAKRGREKSRAGADSKAHGG